MYISRIANDSREQLLVDHLKETAEYAGMIGTKFNCSALTQMAALLHDMGKFSNDFIQYLRSNVESRKSGGATLSRGSVTHSTQGAKYVYEKCHCDAEMRLMAEILALCIAGHHGGLMDSISPQGETPFLRRITSDRDTLNYGEVVKAFEKENGLREDFENLLCNCNDELLSFLETCKTLKLNMPFMLNMLVRTIFSCLVDADRFDSYCFELGKTLEKQIPIPRWEVYAKRLEEYLSTIIIDSEIASVRKDISKKCLNAAKNSPGIFRLAVPTGGGKTLSSLRFALNHAKQHSMEHIIYVIPYLSILEQTAKEIKKVLKCNGDDDFILEHHSNIISSYDDDYKLRNQRLLTERWNKPIIVTTMVQFLESLYSHKGGDLRKIHNISKAVLIFDEVQSLPIKCVYLFNDALNYFKYFGNCTALLCTATQPHLDTVKRPIHLASPPDLIPDSSKAFEKLKRTHLVDSTIRGGYTIETLRDFVLEKMDRVKNCLVILNTKKEVADLYSAVKKYLNKNRDIRVVHLSTSMCPAHRLQAIMSMMEEGDIKKLKRERILCISTQLIEAGVDISFGCVIRALAGLDSIAQAAGRCNRNGEDPKGREVYVINMAEENLSNLPDIKCGSDVTWRIFDELNGDLSNLLSPTVMTRYYKEYFYKREKEGEMSFRCNNGNIYDLLSHNQKGFGAFINLGIKYPLPAIPQAFQNAGEQFYVIEKNKTAVIVPYDKGNEIVNNYNAAFLGGKEKLLREMGKYSVTLYSHQRFVLEEEQALQLVDDGIFLLDKEYYDSDLGVVFHRDPKFLCT